MEAEGEEVSVLGTEGLAADGFEAGGKAEEDGVARHVGEADGEGAARNFEAAEAEDGEHGLEVDDYVHECDRKRHGREVFELSEKHMKGEEKMKER